MTEPSIKKSTRITPLGAVGVAVKVTPRFTLAPGELNVTVGAPAFGGGHAGSYGPPQEPPPPLPPPPLLPPPQAFKTRMIAVITLAVITPVRNLRAPKRTLKSVFIVDPLWSICYGLLHVCTAASLFGYQKNYT